EGSRQESDHPKPRHFLDKPESGSPLPSPLPRQSSPVIPANAEIQFVHQIFVFRNSTAGLLPSRGLAARHLPQEGGLS
ncbi:MAG: hypothetical protein LBI87_04675, partial [Candidatus Accumulibacter sp.]|nr:hypothetical protein [Accumulibacter sp.]